MSAVASVLPVFRRELRQTWRETLGWTLGLAAVLLVYLPLYPSFAGQSQMQEILDMLPEAMVRALGFDLIATGAGYTQSTFFGLLGFVLTSLAAAGWGAQAIAGNEESGRLELDLAHGIGRVGYALELALAMFARLVWFGVFSALVLFALNGPAQLDLEPGNVVAACATMVGLAFVPGAFALATGALTGRRSLAMAVGSIVLAGAYGLNAVANQSADLDSLRRFSPYGWAWGNAPLMNGVDWPGLAALGATSVVLVVLAAWFTRRRDVTG